MLSPTHTEDDLRDMLARAPREFIWKGWEKSVTLSRAYMGLQMSGAVRMPTEQKVRVFCVDFRP
jgi:hypothetical protein